MRRGAGAGAAAAGTSLAKSAGGLRTETARVCAIARRLLDDAHGSDRGAPAGTRRHAGHHDGPGRAGGQLLRQLSTPHARRGGRVRPARGRRRRRARTAAIGAVRSGRDHAGGAQAVRRPDGRRGPGRPFALTPRGLGGSGARPEPSRRRGLRTPSQARPPSRRRWYQFISGVADTPCSSTEAAITGTTAETSSRASAASTPCASA